MQEIFRSDRSSFVQAYNAAARVIRVRPGGAAENCVLFTPDTETQTLRMVGTNLEVTVFQTIQTDVSVSCSVLIDRMFLDGVIGSLHDKTIILEHDDAYRYILRCGGVQLSFSTIDPDDFPIPDTSMYQPCLSFAGEEIRDRVMQAFLTEEGMVHVFVHNNQLYMETAGSKGLVAGTSRVAVAAIEHTEATIDQEWTFTPDSMRILADVLGNSHTRVAMLTHPEYGTAAFSSGSSMILGRLFGTQFPNVQKAYDYPYLFAATVSAKSMAAACTLIGAVDDKAFDTMHLARAVFEFDRDHVTVKSVRGQSGRQASTVVPVTMNQDHAVTEWPVVAMLSAAQIGRGITALKTEHVTLGLVENRSGIGFWSMEAPHYQARFPAFGTKK